MKQCHEWIDGRGLTRVAEATDRSFDDSALVARDNEICRLSAEVDRLKALTSEEDRARSEHYARWADEAHMVFCQILSHFNVGELKGMNLLRIIDKVRDLMWTCPGDIGKSLHEQPKEAE